MSIDSLKQRIQPLLPSQPGVYQMLDHNGRIIYIGKARRLKNRVNSYFQKLSNIKTATMMLQVADIKITITRNENEALLLEDKLVKQFRPRYNILLRDDKSYPYLYLSVGQDFPRLDFYRGDRHQPGRYFGPYPSAKAVRENLAFIQKLFKLRQCEDSFFSHRTRPCLQYQIDRCTAPCVAYVSKENYHEQVKHVLLFLEGQNDQIIADLMTKMEMASQQLRYERAMIYRDQIRTLRQLQETQATLGKAAQMDVIAAAEAKGYLVIMVLFVRNGCLLGNKAFYPQIPLGENTEEALAAFLPQYYLNPLHREVPIDRIVLTQCLSMKLWIQSAIQESLGKKVKIIDKKTLAFQQWQELADLNAKQSLAQHVAEKDSMAVKLEALKTFLDWPLPIQRIECFDVSHTLGEATVASCVVFNEEGPVFGDYRRFNIKNITLGDDYAALRQAMTRRYVRLKEEGGVLPDFVMIDGGRGQLNQAISVFEELQVSGVGLLAIAKGPTRKPGLEELWVVGRDYPLKLEADHVALHVIQWIRDEAHRFAITAHRKQRNKARIHSILENIEGIGLKRRRELLRHFGGLQGLEQAGIEDLAKVNGISRMLAERIYHYLRDRNSQ